MVTRLPASSGAPAAAAGGGVGQLRPGFPYATVLVSGGHNMVLLTTGIGKHTIQGSTLDDSIGEAFDKTARYDTSSPEHVAAHTQFKAQTDT